MNRKTSQQQVLDASEKDFDLVRLSHAKEIVDVSPNTVRKLAEAGLPIYRSGRAVFFSKRELEAFIKANGRKK
jgi:phage terminase Nu1 subunit (DNA packaging protein)